LLPSAAARPTASRAERGRLAAAAFGRAGLRSFTGTSSQRPSAARAQAVCEVVSTPVRAKRPVPASAAAAAAASKAGVLAASCVMAVSAASTPPTLVEGGGVPPPPPPLPPPSAPPPPVASPPPLLSVTPSSPPQPVRPGRFSTTRPVAAQPSQ
jgi:hypothetical protein